jgi:hypothetical protein
LVFPIPPGVRWNDEMPRILPVARAAGPCLEDKKAMKKNTGRRPVPQNNITAGGLRFVEAKALPAKPKASRGPKPKVKNDPKLVAAARDLRDRWLEKVNSPGGEPLLLSQGKYDVSRTLASPPVKEIPQLPHAIAA